MSRDIEDSPDLHQGIDAPVLQIGGRRADVSRMDRPVPIDRRIGRRVPIDPVDVTWVITVQESGRFGRRRETVQEVTGRIVDVSVTGAAIEGPRQSGPRIGAQATIRGCGGDSVVKVRRSQGTDRPETCIYGVEFVDLHPGLAEQVTAILQRGRPSESAWRRSL